MEAEGVPEVTGGHGGGNQKERFTILEAGACPRVEQTRLGFTLALAKPRALQCNISGDANSRVSATQADALRGHRLVIDNNNNGNINVFHSSWVDRGAMIYTKQFITEKNKW